MPKLRIKLLGQVCALGLVSLSLVGYRVADSRSVLLFKQPYVTGPISNYLLVPPASSEQAKKVRDSRTRGSFQILSWQSNPAPESMGLMIPNTCRATYHLTGMSVVGNASKYQSAYSNACGSSMVQLQGSVMGVYLTSSDLPNGSHRNKMMITPVIRFPKPVYIYSTSQGFLQSSFDLQVPVAEDRSSPKSKTFVNANYLFRDKKSGGELTFNVMLFFHRHDRPIEGSVRVDRDTSDFMFNAPLLPQTKRVDMMTGSDVYQGKPWLGWKGYKYRITKKNMLLAIDAAKKAYPSVSLSSDPADYGLIQFHLNAELHFDPLSAEATRLGWSMRNMEIKWGKPDRSVLNTTKSMQDILFTNFVK